MLCTQIWIGNRNLTLYICVCELLWWFYNSNNSGVPSLTILRCFVVQKMLSKLQIIIGWIFCQQCHVRLLLFAVTYLAVYGVTQTAHSDQKPRTQMICIIACTDGCSFLSHVRSLWYLCSNPLLQCSLSVGTKTPYYRNYNLVPRLL